MFCKYNCKINIFEISPTCIKILNKNFSDNEKVTVFPFGLSDKNQIVDFYENNDSDSSSIHIKSENSHKVTLQNFKEFCKKNNINQIDLIKINIEGGEYDLMDGILSSGFIKNIKNIQIQFHDFIINADLRKEMIRKELSKTHRLTYQYDWIWENWEKR